MWSALGRHPGPHAGHRLDRCPVPGNPAAPHALSHPCSASGWRFRVRRRLRAGLPATRPALVRFVTAISQAQRRGRARPADSHRGVLSGHGLLAGDEETQPRAATVGADLQHGAATSVARLLPRNSSCCGVHFRERNENVSNLLDDTRTSNGLPPCGKLVPMPKRNLRIVKRTPIALAICEACNMHFHSKQPVEDNAEIDMKIQFTKHKCKPVESSQGALRIVREATENK